MLTALAMAGCAGPAAPPPNALLGTWANADNQTITIRPDTVVFHQPNGQNAALGGDVCGGNFSFAYARESSRSLAGLLPRQPDLDKQLSALLVAPTYPVARLHCDRGDQTYVLLNDQQMVAIYRDGDIGAIERLARQ